MFLIFRPSLLLKPRRFCRYATVTAQTSAQQRSLNRTKYQEMVKKKPPIPESVLVFPNRSANAPAIVDTHTHIASTYAAYRTKYPEGRFSTVHELFRGVTEGHRVEAVVDVWCEAPVRAIWRELADSAVSEDDRAQKWGGTEYYFAMGVHPHEARHYNDDVEKNILEAMAHPRCVGWGEIGLDYHYDLSPRDVQQDVFSRQLRHAVKLGKPLTVHTREADEDTERILKAEVPSDHKVRPPSTFRDPIFDALFLECNQIHIHCFTDTPEFAQRLLDHFPNLYIGITGVITYSSNLNTSATIKNMIQPPSEPQSEATSDRPPTATGESLPSTSIPRGRLRILLETDAPYMVPGNIYDAPSLSTLKNKRLPICHTAMIPWTAEFVASVLGDGRTAEDVLLEARENARAMYGI
ncbi:hypothetical protein HGRIS_008883 [Hohenbuehelia grisea]|uniref:Uncharacterized protein n=1 Tax=Hohenbuehelia grisea TaxID=104357 RepID=A0ABR3IZY1_9AGAR